MFIKVTFITLASLLAAALSSCTPAGKRREKPEGTEKDFKTLKEGVLTVGKDVAFSPCELKDKKHEKLLDLM